MKLFFAFPSLLLLISVAGATPASPFSTFRVTTDNAPKAEIAGVVLPTNEPARGTLFLCHGYASSKETFNGYHWIRDSLHWNLVAFDFREHGQSTHDGHLCTLGYYEIDDLKAVVDFAESQHLARPYALYGRSMGAATALRWGSRDPRVVGVFAQSPFKDALTASEEFPSARLGFNLPSPFRLVPEFAAKLRSVDVPSAVVARNDLRICILAGENDCFPIPEQQSIIEASASPAAMKSFYVAPGFGHRGLWAWKGDSHTPGHDELVTSFLGECESDYAAALAKGAESRTANAGSVPWHFKVHLSKRAKVSTVIGSGVLALFGMVRVYRRRVATAE